MQNYLFHDITTGNNAYTVTDDNGNVVKIIPGYSAKPGWDAATGFGTPKAEPHRAVPGGHEPFHHRGQ